MYLLGGHHEPLIDGETFAKAGVLLKQRVKEQSLTGHSSGYAFSGKCFCGRCGAALRRRVVHCTIGDRVFWDCGKHAEDPAACGFLSVPDSSIRNAFVTMMNKLKFCPLVLELYLESRESAAFHKPECESTCISASFFEKWDGCSFPENIFREVVERVDIFGRNEFRFMFTCGLVLTEKIGESEYSGERMEGVS